MLVVVRWSLFGALLACAAFLSLGCKRPRPADVATQPPWFADATEELGLDFTHDPGTIDGTYFMPQSMGSGAAVFDFDNDGRLDIYLVHNAGPNSASKNRLFHQQPDGKFKDVSAGSGLDFAGHCMGIAVGDVNNDGLPDVYVSEYDGGRFFLNRGDGRFDEIKSSGIDKQIWGTAVSFLDYNRDGWLDLIVVNYVALDPTRPCSSPAGGSRDYCHPDNFKPTATRLYRNRGNDANGNWLGFEDQTDAAGLNKASGPGLGVLCADFNGDGWLDIFVANDSKANHLWINQKDGTFIEEAVARGLAFNARGDPQANMGVAWGDIDGSGLPSLFVTHLNYEYHGLWKQGPRGLFHEQAAATGLTKLGWRGTGFGTVFADFDNDGALDLALVNGRVFRTGPPTNPHWDAYAERNQVLAGDGAGTFRDVSASNLALCGKPNVARGLALGDLNGDGGLDLLVTTIGGKARILRNVADKRGHWLTVRALDGKRDAVGAEVRIAGGTRRWQGLVQPSQSYLCSNDPRVHFGLGGVDRIETIDIQWVDGVAERFPCPGVDRVIEVQRGKGQPAK
ncbi:MAG: CRTAC1 family protein [Planctomycetes bacterium]|nr:CRTAC1 family protein [Planctomycetota bacterium]